MTPPGVLAHPGSEPRELAQSQGESGLDRRDTETVSRELVPRGTILRSNSQLENWVSSEDGAIRDRVRKTFDWVENIRSAKLDTRLTSDMQVHFEFPENFRFDVCILAIFEF